MCLAVYIASDAELPLMPYVQGESVLHAKVDERKPRRLRRRHAVYVGAHEGCACGFLTDGIEPGSVEHEANTKSLAALRDYISTAARLSDLNVFACWEGDQQHEPSPVLDVQPGFFIFGNTPFDTAAETPVIYQVRRE
jgi:hypothetical protein